MKRMKSIMVLSSLMMVLATSLLMISCERVDLDSTENGESKENGTGSSSASHKVTVIARSASTQGISYPIEVYAYNTLGEETAHQTVSSASEGISLSLSEGQYTIAAISGSSSFDFAKGYSTSPLMTGSTTVTVGSSALTANIVMSYAVAALSISMTDVPSSITGASVTISSQYSSVNTLREYSGMGSVTIPCSKVGDTWQTGTVYVLPGCNESTALTIALSSATGTTSYGITYNSALKAATPYNFTGSYSSESSDVKLTGTLSYDDWLAVVDGSFSFGPSGSNCFSGEDVSVETIKVSSIPAEGSVYDGHLVALVGTTESGVADALLISVKEWSSLTSALYEADPDVAKKIANSYVEGSLSGWSIPTSNQVKELKEVWSSDNLATLNGALASVTGSDELAISGDDGKNVRYLCENGRYTYAWAKGGSIVAAGKTVKTYRLRVVKRVRFCL